MSVETALSYAALILADSEIEISSEKLLTLTNAANVPMEGIWADIFSRALEAQNLKDLLVNFSVGASVGGVAGVAGGAGGEAAGEGEEEKEEEAKEESDDDMGFGLFD